MEKIKLALVDDQVLFLKGMKLLLSSQDNIDLIIEAGNGQEIVDAVEENKPDVILMDIRMPVMDGEEATRIIKEKHPDIKILLLSMDDDERLINHMMKIGANGYLLKNEEPEVVIEAIETVMKKDFYFNEYVSKALLKGSSAKITELNLNLDNIQKTHLTRREAEVLQLVCKAFTTSEIAKLLFLSDRTIEGHRKNLLEKTDTRNTAALIVYAIKNELVGI